jgi:glycosyltransferase involved in cell wall biosynthesis
MTISIGLPFFNNSATLPEAVRSVFAQTYQDWELILVDDGSTDNSLEIARAIRDPRVQVHSDGVNRGLCLRLNQIAKLARTPFLASMHGDDVMHPERLARQYRYLEENSRVDLVGTAIYSIDGHGNVVGIRGRKPLDVRPRSVLRKGLAVHPTILGRTDWFRKNLYDPLYVRAEDHELWCRSVGHTTFGKIAEPLLFYREGHGSLASYLTSQRTDRMILRKYGPAIFGNLRTTGLILLTHAKGWTYRLCTWAGMGRHLVSFRNRSISAVERSIAMNILHGIDRTFVPGLDDRCSVPAENSRHDQGFPPS